MINWENSFILKTSHKLKIIKHVNIILINCGILKNFPITFSENKINPFKKPHSMKFKLAPCHNPAIDITNIKLKNKFFLEFLDPPKGIYK